MCIPQAADLSAESVLTYTDNDGYPEVNGYISYEDGASYSIDNCGDGCHVLIHNTVRKQTVNDVVVMKELDKRDLLPEVIKAAAMRHSITLHYILMYAY